MYVPPSASLALYILLVSILNHIISIYCFDFFFWRKRKNIWQSFSPCWWITYFSFFFLSLFSLYPTFWIQKVIWCLWHWYIIGSFFPFFIILIVVTYLIVDYVELSTQFRKKDFPFMLSSFLLYCSCCIFIFHKILPPFECLVNEIRTISIYFWWWKQKSIDRIDMSILLYSTRFIDLNPAKTSKQTTKKGRLSFTRYPYNDQQQWQKKRWITVISKKWTNRKKWTMK